MPNVSSFGAQTDNAVVSGTVTDRQMIIPEVPPQGLMSVGPRVTPNFVQTPWSKANSYNFFDVVKDSAGASYIAIKPVIPANTELTNEEFWFKWSDPDAQLSELQNIVNTFDARISKNTADISEKAPDNHASQETIYGIGNEVNYGHVQLSDEGVSDSNAGKAATPKMVVEKAFNLLGKKVVFLGDSITNGSNEGEIETTFPQQFANVTGADVTNLAIGGASAANIEIAPSTAWKQAQQVTQAYDYAFFMFGTNDYGYGSAAPMGTVGSSDKGTVCGGLGEAVKLVQKTFPLTKVIGIIPPYMPGDTVVKDGRTALNVKAMVASVYTMLNVPYIDLTHGLGYNAENWDAHLADWDKNLTRLHPNQSTYIEIGNYIAYALSVNSYGRWDWEVTKVGSNLGLTPAAGTTVSQSNLGPIAVFDPQTHDLYIDFGDGFTTNATSETIFTLPVKNNYRTFYFPLCAYKTSNPADQVIRVAGITKASEGPSEIKILGASSVQEGLTFFGSVTVPYYYL